MKRLVPIAACSMVGFALFALACSPFDASEEATTPGPDGGASPDGQADQDGAILSDAAGDDASTGEAPVTVLSTTESVLDIGVSNGKLFLLLDGPSRVETCDSAACGVRTVRVGSAQMPPEMPRVVGGAPNFYLNARMSVLPVGATDAIVIAQNGNIPCAVDCTVTQPDNPGVYAIGASPGAPPSLLLRMTFAEFSKGANESTVEDTRGNALWFRNSRNNEAAGSNSIVLLTFKPAVAPDEGLAVGVTRTDTQPVLAVKTGLLLAGAHRVGAPYITRSAAATTELVAIDPASIVATENDLPIGIPNARFFTTTGTLRFARNAQTTTDAQLLQSSQGTTVNTVVTLPGVTSATTILGTEPGLLWFTQSKVDGGTGGLMLSFCSDTSLLAKTCAPKPVKLDLDEITRVKDEAPYLYVFGRRAGKNVVVRWRTPS